MKKIALTSLVFILVLSGDVWAEQAGEGRKASPMQGMMQEMMKGEQSGKGSMEGMGDMDGMMRMMKMMGQCAAMMEQCCGTAGSGEKKEGQNK